MTFDDIQIFAKVVDQKSFTNAAKLLRMPKSTVSRRIFQLEERLGVKLLNRTTRQLSLTPIGQAYYEKCVIVLDHLQDAEDLIKGLHTKPRGHLRVTIPYELGLFFMKEAFMEFLKSYPEIIVELELANRMVDIVEEGFDLAIRIGHLPDSSLVAVKLLELEGGVYASSAYLKNRSIPKTPSDLPLTECIQFGISQANIWRFQHSIEGKIEVKPAGRLRVNSMGYLCEAALSGLGFAAINKVIASPYVQEGRLIEILSDYKLSFPNIYAIYPSRKHLSSNVRTFINFIRPRLAQLKHQF